MFSSSHRKTGIIAGLVLCVVFWVYLPVLQNGFVNYDDDVHILQNPFIHPLDGDHLSRIFSTTVNRIYIPLTQLSFAVDYALFGPDPVVFHGMNLLLHLMNVLLVISLARVLGLSRGTAAIAALIFGLHPMHVESVAWATERKDVLYACLYLSSVIFYLLYLQRAEGQRQGGEVRPVLCSRYSGLIFLGASFSLGLLSALAKPMALSLPFALLLLDWYTKRRISPLVLLEKFALGAVFFPVIWVTYSLNSHVQSGLIGKQVVIWLWCAAFYVKKFFYPDFFVLFYPPPDLGDAAASFSTVIFCGALAVSVLVFRRKRLFVLAVLWYLLSAFFLFRTGLGKDSQIVADRFMYLPSLGFCLWLGFLLEQLFVRFQGKRWGVLPVVMALGIILSLLYYKTEQQIGVWNSSLSLWKNQIEKGGAGQPRLIKALILTKYADAQMEALGYSGNPPLYFSGRLQAYNIAPELFKNIESCYWDAVRFAPVYVPAWYGLARVYAVVGKLSLAEKYLRHTVALDPEHFDAYIYLGQICFLTQRIPLAVDAFERALAVNPDNARVRQQIAAFYRDNMTAVP